MRSCFLFDAEQHSIFKPVEVDQLSGRNHDMHTDLAELEDVPVRFIRVSTAESVRVVTHDRLNWCSETMLVLAEFEHVLKSISLQS